MIKDRLFQARVALRMLLRLTDRGSWVTKGVLGCAYPRTDRALDQLSRRGIRVLVNLHHRQYDPQRLCYYGLREVHLPVKDFQAPSSEQIRHGVEKMREARQAGEAVAVHCGGGFGRTGTLLACYLVSEKNLEAGEAVERVRSLRPGSVETRAQVAAVEAWARESQGYY